MLIPPTWVFVVGALLTAVLATTDWYVWGMNLATNPRQPRRPQPLSGLELVDLALGRLVAVNQAVLPRVALEARAGSSPVATNPDDGFRRVA
jgi:hypothetical protein